MTTSVEWSKPDPLDGCPWGCGAPAGHGDAVKCPPMVGDDWANRSTVALGTRSQLRGDLAALGATRDYIRTEGGCEPCSRAISRRMSTIAGEIERRRG